jgi:hypothetical protein
MRIPRNFLRDTITVEASQGSGARGPTYASAAVIKASVQPSNRLAVMPDGRQIVADLQVLIRPEETVPVESRVTWLTKGYRVLMASPMPDEFRPTHIELLLGAFAP